MQPRREVNQSTRRSQVLSWTVGVVALVTVPFGLTACGTRENTINAENRIGTAPAETPPMGVKLGDLLDNPGKYAGRVVTVSGEVNDVLGPKAFSIGGEEFLPPGELLVVSPNGFPTIPDRPKNEYLVDDDIVQVTGTVRTFVRAEMNRTVDPDDLEGSAYLEWEGKPVLVVSNMITTPRAGTVVKNRPGTRPLTDMLVIFNAPDRMPLVGKTVELNHAQVQSVISDKGFWIGSDAKQRLFVRLQEERTPATPTEGKVDVNAGQTVSLSGTIRKMPEPSELQKQWGLTAADSAPVQSEQIYLQADRVQVLKR